MSTEVVSWENKLAEDAKAVAELYRPSVGRIGFKSGVMTYAGNVIPGNKTQVVVLGSAFERNFYTGRYDPDKLVNPSCFAMGLTNENMLPHAEVPTPEHENCRDCPRNEWGSDLQGRKGKACKEIVRLALLPASAVESAEAVAKSDLAICKLPVTSVRNWGSYVNKLATMINHPPWAVVTEISLTPDAKTQFKVNFQEVTAIKDVEILGAINGRIKAAQDILLTPYDYTKEAQEPEKADAGKKKKY
jgi:hypothetical protein